MDEGKEGEEGSGYSSWGRQAADPPSKAILRYL